MTDPDESRGSVPEATRSRSSDGGDPPAKPDKGDPHVKRQILALMGAVALAAPLIGTIPAQAVQPRDVPDSPAITSVNPGPNIGDVTIDWDAPNSPGIVNYQVEYLAASGGTPVTLDPTGNTKTIAIVDDLDPSTQFSFAVRAQNGDGWSEWSDFSDFVNPAALQKPTNLRATSQAGGVLLRWEAPAVSFSGTYVIESQANVPQATWEPVHTVPSDTTSWVADDLSASTTYLFRVRAASGGQTSGWDTTTSYVGPGTAPAAPSFIQPSAGNAQATLTWGLVSGADSYDLQQCASGAAPAPTDACWRAATPATASGTTSTTTATGLTNGTAYFFRIRTVRGSITSDWTTTSAAVTPSGAFVVPAAPTSVNASPGNGLAYMYWAVPAGNPATSYNVQYSTDNANWLPAAGRNTGSTALSYTLTGLANGVAYYLRVQTVNGNQASGWTQMAGFVVPAGTPGPPTNVSAVAGNAQATVNWVAPAYSATPITGYRVQYSINGGVTWITAVDLTLPFTSTTVGGLSNGTAYIFRVQATTHVGDGSWSAPSGSIVPPGGPAAPTTVVAVAGNASAQVSWSASPGVAGFPILGYRVASNPGGFTCATSATPPSLPATTCAVSGLTNGQAYTFTVVAISNAGVSASSAPSAAVVPVGGPSAPTSVTAGAGERAATVSWTPSASTAGGPVTSYRVTSSPDGRTCTTQATPPATPATTCTVNGLTNGQAYTFTVVAISATGTSASSPASAPVTPFTTEVTIRITDSSRDGRKIIIKGTTQGVDPGDTLDVLIRNSGKGKFNPAGEVTVKANGTFRWTSTNVNKTWVRVTDGDVVSNTVIIPAR